MIASLNVLILAGLSQLAQATPAPAATQQRSEPLEEPTLSPDDSLTKAAAVGPEWAAFAKIAASMQTSVAILAAHEQLGATQFTKTIKISYRKPSYALCEIVAGDGKGGAAAWRGGNKVKAHPGGDRSSIIAVLPRHEQRVTDLAGYACGDTVPDQMVSYSEAHGTLAEASGPAVDGAPTDLVTWTPAKGLAYVKVDREEFYISKSTHLPVETKGYVGTTQIEDTKYSWQIDTPLNYSIFNF